MRLATNRWQVVFRTKKVTTFAYTRTYIIHFTTTLSVSSSMRTSPAEAPILDSLASAKSQNLTLYRQFLNLTLQFLKTPKNQK